MNPKAHGENSPAEILYRSVENDRVHSAYLLTGSGEIPTTTARDFARALVCDRANGTVCEHCDGCQRSNTANAEGEDVPPIVLDGKGKRGPTYRHIGDHPDLFWLERGADDTRITIGQTRDLQKALRLGANEGGRRVAVIAEAQWLTTNAQNALLRLLEEPPPATSLILVATHASAIIATIRSRSVRVRFPVDSLSEIRDPEAPESVSQIVETLDQLGQQSVGDLLDFAEQYRGGRAVAAEAVTELIDVSAQWLCEEVKTAALRGDRPSTRELDAHRSLQQLRRDLITRNANPQMVAERLLLGLRDVVA
jgi:DNA polymerase-3 subunit delta'